MEHVIEFYHKKRRGSDLVSHSMIDGKKSTLTEGQRLLEKVKNPVPSGVWENDLFRILKYKILSDESAEKKGRPYKYGEPLIPVTFRIPKSKVEQVGKYVAEVKDEALITYSESQPKKKRI